MNHATLLYSVEPCIALDGFGLVDRKNEATIGRGSSPSIVSELRCLPQLALVFAEILNDKWMHRPNRQQPLSSCVDAESTQVRSNPSAVEPFCDYWGRPGATKTVKDEVALVRRSRDYS